MLATIKPQSIGCCKNSQCAVPPSPKLLAQLHARYSSLLEEGRIPESMSFEDYYAVWLSGRRGTELDGLDDGATSIGTAKGPLQITRPAKKLKGKIPTLVLLVDFPDRPHSPDHSAGYYRQMLFSEQTFPSGSMRDYFHRVSNWNRKDHGIDVTGEVHGWYRMPNPMSYYADGASGMGDNFPRNSQALARDAVLAAKAAGVDFTDYDVLGENSVTALFIVHSGLAAEESGDRGDIWSHKWVIPGGVKVGTKLSVKTYLTVSEECQVGVCAHEWGHLAARWADYYDTGKSENHRSQGLGHYCPNGCGILGK